MLTISTRVPLLFGLPVLVASLCSAQTPQYTATWVGGSVAGSTMNVRDIDEDGLVGAQAGLPVRITAQGVATRAALPPGASMGEIWASRGLGTMVGDAWRNGVREAAIWQNGGSTATSLAAHVQSNPTSGRPILGLAVNALGAVVSIGNFDGGAVLDETFYLDPTGTLYHVRGVSTNGATGAAVSDTGIVVGHSPDLALFTHAMRWDLVNGTIDLHDELLGVMSMIHDVDRGGSRAVGVITENDTNLPRPALWDLQTNTATFVPLAPGFNNGQAEAINVAGEIVGSMSPAGPPFAFVHTGGQTYDLSSLAVDLPPGVILEEAVAIDESGRILAWDYGFPSPDSYLLTPLPEPQVTIYCTAKTSSAGCVATIGTTDLLAQPTSGASDYSVTASAVQELKNGLIIASLSGSAALPFHGGILCMVPPTKRGSIMSSGGDDPNECDGNFSTLVNNGAIVPLGLDPGAGNSAWYQYWYRDPQNGAGNSGSSLSNAVQLDFE